MNISENAEAILNEIEKKYASIDQKRNAFRRLTLVQTNDILGLYQTDANIQTQGQRFQMKWFYHVSSGE
jgi:hypothetical protein